MSLANIIQNAFRRSKYASAKEWHTDSKMPLSYFTLTKTIDGAEPSVPSFIVMAYLIGIPIKDIADACKEAGDTVFWRILTDSQKEK